MKLVEDDYDPLLFALASDDLGLLKNLLEERIEVRGGDPVVERVLVTPRGPVISPALAGEHPAVHRIIVTRADGVGGGVVELHEPDLVDG